MCVPLTLSAAAEDQIDPCSHVYLQKDGTRRLLETLENNLHEIRGPNSSKSLFNAIF